MNTLRKPLALASTMAACAAPATAEAWSPIPGKPFTGPELCLDAGMNPENIALSSIKEVANGTIQHCDVYPTDGEPHRSQATTIRTITSTKDGVLTSDLVRLDRYRTYNDDGKVIASSVIGPVVLKRTVTAVSSQPRLK